MADDEKQHVEKAFNTLVIITEKSGNLRKHLNNVILVFISNLREIFSKIKTQLENKYKENKILSKDIMEVNEEMAKFRDSQPVREVTPYPDHKQQTSRSGARPVPPSEGRKRKLFSNLLQDGREKRYKTTLKAKDKSQTPEQIKLQLKKFINPTDIKVGIKTLKTLREGRILIETGTEEEIDSLSSAISTKCSEQLEIGKRNLRKPRLIIYNFQKKPQ